MVTNALTGLNKTSLAVELEKRNINGQVWKVLRETIFPGAEPASILMAIDYCKVRHLDILKKPVHIVPIWDSEKKKNIDSIWHGISELRTTAMRTKNYAGVDETVYGEDITREIGGVTITFPKYAQVTVYRIINGVKVPFAGDKVFWLETFAKKKDGSPNAMWRQRPYGQIAKCAEAAALRKAFPEEIGNEYTAEEMEGQKRYNLTETIEQLPPVVTTTPEEKTEIQTNDDPFENFEE